MNLLHKYAPPRNANTKESDGIVVWDHNGLVVVWPDGHHSRFSWTRLRQVCHCTECQRQQAQRTNSSNSFSAH